MIKKLRIIHILCHTLMNDDKLVYHIYGNFAARQAQNIQKYSNKYEHEVWYAVQKLQHKKTYRKNNITYKIFPAITIWGLLESFFGLMWSMSIFNELKKYNPENTIIHFHGERGSLIHTILFKYPNFRYVIQYHGYGQPAWLDWMEQLFITPIEKKMFPRISFFYPHVKRRVSYLQKNIGIPKHKISLSNVGVDFDVFKPRNKHHARKKLNLPENAFILLYVGLMTPTKGVDTILKSYRKLKPYYPNLLLLLIGAQKQDALYEEAKKTADVFLGTIPNDKLPLYYNSADVYCFFGNKKTTEYAGVGTAPGEALASNINVISTNLIHFPSELRNKVGFIPTSTIDFLNKLEYLIKHPHYQFKPRKLVYKYISIEYKMKNTIQLYEKLFQSA